MARSLLPHLPLPTRYQVSARRTATDGQSKLRAEYTDAEWAAAGLESAAAAGAVWGPATTTWAAAGQHAV